MDEGVQNNFFTRMLRLTNPWRATEVTLSDDGTVANITVSCGNAKRFRCPDCGELCPVYDKITRTWRHLDMCGVKCYVTADVPRANCEKCGVKRIRVPWADP